MKKYSENISRLYENVGYEKIEAGKTYTTSKGDKIEIKEIYIDATDEIPEVYVDYKAEMVNGDNVEEKNRYGVVIDMIRAK